MLKLEEKNLIQNHTVDLLIIQIRFNYFSLNLNVLILKFWF
jgi:hypothetical protein